jgi:hypothetical protein
MTPEIERELVKKVDAIYTALFGLQGQPDTGRIQVLEKTVGVGKFTEDPTSHSARLTNLERWRWYVLGAGAATGYLINLAVKAVMGGH